jgi:peptidoglycan/LPS O-acetylase OafA/YrhL
MNAARPERLASLTGLRFTAALGILLFHYGAPLVSGAPAFVVRVQLGGHAWVGLFYVLSGFVLAYANPAPMSRADRRAFLAGRLARLYPAYLLAFVLSAPFAVERWSGGGAAGAAKMALVAGASLLLVQAWAPPIARLWNAPGWSTSVVAAFQAAFPFLAARLAPLGRRGLAAALGGAWALSLVFPVAYLALRPDGALAETLAREPRWLEALKFHPVARAGEFGAGVALGFLHARGVSLGRRGAAAAALALVAALAALAWGGIPYVLLHNGALVPLWAIVVLGLADGSGALSRALGSRPLRTLGDASFALYALQDPLWRWARALGGDAEPGPGYVVLFGGIAIAIAVVVSRAAETPVRRALRRVLAPAGAPARPA